MPDRTAKVPPGRVTLIAALQDVTEVLAVVKKDRSLPPGTRARYVCGWERFLADARAGNPTRLEACLGLSAIGQHSWNKIEGRARRDVMLRELRAARFAQLSTAAAALEIRRLVGRGSHLTSRIISATGQTIPALRQLRTILHPKDTPARPLPPERKAR